MKDFDQVEVTSRAAWRKWLADHHQQPESIWLVAYKKHTGDLTKGSFNDLQAPTVGCVS